MKTGRKILAFVLLISLLFASAQTAQGIMADSIAEPYNDDFYWSHIDECRHVQFRSYIANGPDNQVILYKAPDSAAVICKEPNGTELSAEWLYNDADGITWAYVWSCEAWTPFEYLIPVYDFDAFMEEFSSQIQKADGASASRDLLGTEIYYFAYPGAEENGKLTLGTEYTLSLNAYFTDEMGRLWGSMDYYYGVRRAWVCLDDIHSDFAALWPDGAPARNVNSNAYAEGRYEEPAKVIKPASVFPTEKVIIIAAIALAALGTVLIVIVVLKRKRTQNTDGKQE